MAEGLKDRLGRLHTVVADLNEQAADRLDLIIRQMMKAEGVTEAMKAENQMLWVQSIFAQLAEQSPDPVVAGQNKKQPRGGAALKRLIKQIGAERQGDGQEHAAGLRR